MGNGSSGKGSNNSYANLLCAMKLTTQVVLARNKRRRKRKRESKICEFSFGVVVAFRALSHTPEVYSSLVNE